jgi:beta-lactamase superfamily II metal-dependent hydrolase
VRGQAVARAAGGLPPLASSAHALSPVRRAVFRWSLVVVSAVVLLGACGAAAPALAAGNSRIDFLNLGPGGEATLLRLSSGATILIDGGPNGPALEEALTARLPFWQRSLDLALLTDQRAGDTAGLQDVTAHFEMAQAADAGAAHPTAVYLAWLDALARAGIPHVRIRQNDVIHVQSDTTLTVLGPPQTLYLAAGGATTASNDLMVRLDTPGLRVLFLGSADAYALDALAFAGEPLAADVVEVALPPDTGINLDSSLGQVLLAAHPRLVVVTQAPPSARPHVAPPPTTIWPPDAPTAASLGALIVRTSSAGTVSLTARPDGGWDLLGA